MTHSKNDIKMFPKWDYILFTLIYGYGWNIFPIIFVVLFSAIIFDNNSVGYLPFPKDITSMNLLLLEAIFLVLMLFFYFVIYFVYKSDYTVSLKKTNNILYSENSKIKQQSKSYIAPILVLLFAFNIHIFLLLLFFLNKLYPIIPLEFIQELYSYRSTSLGDPILLVFVSIQLVQISIVVGYLYRKCNSTFSKKYLQSLNEQIIKLTKKEYSQYSRFWLYLISISLLVAWIFIHPITLIIAKLFS